MRIGPRSGEIRLLVAGMLQALGTSKGELDELHETVLLDGGRYRARTYRAGDFFAMWLVEIGLLQFYDHEGNMLRTVNLFEEKQPQRAAA